METNNALYVIRSEIDWLSEVIDQVIRSYLMQEGHERNWKDIAVPDISEENDAYSQTVHEWGLSKYDRLALALAMAPSIRPEVLDIFFGRNQLYDRGFTEFGGITDTHHSGFIPTGQTLIFLMAATEPELRYEAMKVLSQDHLLYKEQVLVLSQTDDHIPNQNGALTISERWLSYFLTGIKPKIEQTISFPAQKISTNLEWKDVVLDEVVMDHLQEINSWLDHGDTLMGEWGLDRMIKPGYRALFYGPPGTGKTLTATLLGKSSGRDVYRVDLSMIVSKYIGETEKNLAKVFDVAQHRKWILFFDEADALFGKRTIANSSNDRHANQQTSYLLQRIEDFPGVVILASNLKANMDDAFTRRFQAMIHFTMPGPEDRYQLWSNAFSGTCQLSQDIDLWSIAENYELAGGSIINVLRYCALSAVHRGDHIVQYDELIKGIRQEFKKENRTVSVTK